MHPKDEILDAAFHGHLEIVRRLVMEDARLVNVASNGEKWEKGSTPLMLSARDENIELVTFLLDHGAALNPSGQDGTALSLAAWGRQRKTTELLLARGADPNATSASGETALHAAAYKGDAEIARMLIERGANVNAKTTTGTTDMFSTSPPVVGETPLHLAAAYGKTEVIKLLIERGADREATDKAGQKPIHWAARNEQGPAIRLLR